MMRIDVYAYMFVRGDMICIIYFLHTARMKLEMFSIYVYRSRKCVLCTSIVVIYAA
jgi:hypothetical protein